MDAARSAVTLQRHIRGWLTRRKVYALKEQERIKKELAAEQARIKREQEEKIKMEKLGRAAASNNKFLTKKCLKI